jgi:NTP pyrophosphatase (non-canonical NTP hydrolase)
MFNGLCPDEAERLFLLLEELGEAQQAIGKVLRHGYLSCHPDRPGPDNRRALERELGDIQCAIDLLCERGDIDAGTIEDSRAFKHQKVKRYLHHQG